MLEELSFDEWVDRLKQEDIETDSYTAISFLSGNLYEMLTGITPRTPNDLPAWYKSLPASVKAEMFRLNIESFGRLRK